jgi:hypothetical protein
MIVSFCRKPWQVTIDYHSAVGHLFLMVREHLHGSVAFSNDAVEHCAGATEVDEHGYTIRCRDEPPIVDLAREIAWMSEVTKFDPSFEPAVKRFIKSLSVDQLAMFGEAFGTELADRVLANASAASQSVPGTLS